MELERILARCKSFEERAAAIYRTFAARTRREPEMCALWTGLARDEESHAKAIARAAGWLDPAQGWHTTLDGWEDDLEEIEERLAYAERPDIGADVDQQLIAAIALERTELDTLFHRLLALLPEHERPHGSEEHTAPLLAMAAQRGKNTQVVFEAALLRAHNLLQHAP
jgi:rubrerythrin